MIVVRSSRKGFTLVELLIVLLVLSVLTWVALPLTKVAVQRGKEIELRRSLRLVRGAIDGYKKLADEKKFEFDEETEGYPPTLEILVEGIEIKDQAEGGETRTRIVKFLRRIPKDPMTGSAEWGLRSYQDDPDTDSWGEENVYDVYTRSQAKALDGSRYRDW